MNPSQDRHITDIIKTYSKRLMGFIRTRVTNDEDAEDILQDVFYQLTENVLLTRPIEQLTSWLFTVTRNKINDRYRKKKELLWDDSTGDDEDDIAVEFEELLYDTDDTPEMVYLRTLFWHALEKALAELPVAQREVFVMHELEGIGFNEIAEITGERLNTLLSRKRYAVAHLRKRLRVVREELLNFNP